MLITKQNSFMKDGMEKRQMEGTVNSWGWDEIELSLSNDYLEKTLQTESLRPASSYHPKWTQKLFKDFNFMLRSERERKEEEENDCNSWLLACDKSVGRCKRSAKQFPTLDPCIVLMLDYKSSFLALKIWTL